MAWRPVVRRIGGALALTGAGAGLAAGAALALAAWTPLIDDTSRVVAFGVAGLLVGAVGAMLLLLAPDRLPPGERPDS